jgi:hypothetical protein
MKFQSKETVYRPWCNGEKVIRVDLAGRDGENHSGSAEGTVQRGAFAKTA